MRLSSHELNILLDCVNAIDAGEIDDIMEDVENDAEREHLQDDLSRLRFKLINELQIRVLKKARDS